MNSSDSRITSSERRPTNYMEVFKRRAPEFPSRNSHLGDSPSLTSECSFKEKTKTETFLAKLGCPTFPEKRGNISLRFANGLMRKEKVPKHLLRNGVFSR